MKTLKPINLASSLLLGIFLSAISFQSIAQEYDDMYFTKADRKTVKVEAKKTNTSEVSVPSYKEAVSTTESVSSKNVNPEYIARYKETESTDASAYSDQDYFVEDYNKDSLITRQIDYAALNKREQMSQSNQNRNYSSPSWGFSPYMSMGYGMGYGMPYGYGYDPFMMGYGPSYSMGFGFGSGFYPSMSMSISMSWGTGYNPWGGWGGYPYRPYGMYGYDPFAYGYSPYYGMGCSAFRGFGMYGMNSYYGSGRPVYIVNYSEQNIITRPRTNRSYADSKVSRVNSAENTRISTTSSRVRVPESVNSSSTDNNRVASQDYSRTQNEYYNDARRNASSTSRIISAESSRSTYLRNSSSTQSSSAVNENRPSRSTSYSNYSGQSTSGTRSASSYSSSGSRSGSSYSTPSSRGTSSGTNSSSFSSGSSSRSSSSFSSGSSGSSSRSYSSGSSGSSGSSSSSGRGGRQ